MRLITSEREAIIWDMLEALGAQFNTLAQHIGAASWAMAIFAFGFLLAIPVVRLDAPSLLLMPRWILRLGKKYVTRQTSPVLLFAFIFLFNAAAIFAYMISGGLVVLPIVFALFTGLNVGAVLLLDAREAMTSEADDTRSSGPPRAWVGFCCLFTVIVEMAVFCLALGMGMRLGFEMHAAFGWETFAGAARPRALAFLILLVPALALAAVAETAAVTAMMRRGGDE